MSEASETDLIERIQVRRRRGRGRGRVDEEEEETTGKSLWALKRGEKAWVSGED
jgi:hypothetical protein